MLEPNALKVFDTSFFRKTKVFTEYFKINLNPNGALASWSGRDQRVSVSFVINKRKPSCLGSHEKNCHSESAGHCRTQNLFRFKILKP
jgi:hypothetical protein